MKAFLAILLALLTYLTLLATASELSEGDISVYPQPQCRGGLHDYPIPQSACVDITQPFLSYKVDLIAFCLKGSFKIYQKPSCKGRAVAHPIASSNDTEIKCVNLREGTRWSKGRTSWKDGQIRRGSASFTCLVDG